MKELTSSEYCRFKLHIISKLQQLGSRFASLVSIIILLLFAAQRAQGQSLPGMEIPEIFVWLSTDGKTLTFTFDKKSSVQGTKYELNTGENEPGWVSDGSNKNITKVVFNASFYAAAKPTTCYKWFFGFEKLSEIEHLDFLNTSETTDMSYMFSYCKSLVSLDLSSFNTANVTDMRYMFSYCSSLCSLNLNNFNTANVTNMRFMFCGCSSLETIYVSGYWNTNKVTSSIYMFFDCEKLKGSQGTTYSDYHIDHEYARVDGGPTSATPGFLTLGAPYACKSTDGSTLTFYCDENKATREGTIYELNTGDDEPGWVSDGSYKNITKVSVDATFYAAKPHTCYKWFYDFCYLTKIENIEYLNTANVTDMRYMFAGCSNLESLDLSSFNTKSVTDMSFMFDVCIALKSLNVSSFNTANVKDMSYMFNDCAGLKSLDLSNFNTANVTDMRYMFAGCSSLTSLNISNFNTANVTDMEAMFYGCSNLKELDLSSFNTTSVIFMSYMFEDCSSLESIYVSGEWNTDKVTDSDDMFTGCTKLKGSKGTTYSESHVDKEYARVDGGPTSATPGYLTLGEPTLANRPTALPSLSIAIKRRPRAKALYMSLILQTTPLTG